MSKKQPYSESWVRTGLAVALAALSLSAGGGGGAAGGAEEHKVKAAYLYHFISFVKWPDQGRAGDSGEVVIGILGEDPFGRDFDPVEGKPVPGGRVLHVRRLGSWKPGMDLSSVQILFIASSERPNLVPILSSVADRPVLTVADSERFLESGGMINLVTADRRVRWEINRRPVRRAGLELSSQLLRLAVRVVYI